MAEYGILTAMIVDVSPPEYTAAMNSCISLFDQPIMESSRGVSARPVALRLNLISPILKYSTFFMGDTSHFDSTSVHDKIWNNPIKRTVTVVEVVLLVQGLVKISNPAIQWRLIHSLGMPNDSHHRNAPFEFV